MNLNKQYLNCYPVRIAYSDSYGSGSTAQQTIISIDTDEGVLAPLGIGEMIIEVRY
jgi:predicted double-glycine peptidase